MNFYQVLGVKPQAAPSDVKKAYFAMAKKYHPDVNPDATARQQFEKAQAAYETLSDDNKRTAYDKKMGLGERMMGGANFTDYHSAKKKARKTGIFSDDENEEDDFQDLYRGDKRTHVNRNQYKASAGEQDFWKAAQDREESKQQFGKKTWDEFDEFFEFNDEAEGCTRDDTRGADIRQAVEISFSEAIEGTKLTVSQDKRILCHMCKGTRAKPGSQPRKCFDCGGRGSVIGNYGIRKRCAKCAGAGCKAKIICESCEGIGV